jgi:hypothetical protein
MAGKMKGFNAKQFFISHGEKVALGVIGLIVLYALGTANWIPYDGDPAEITAKIRESRQTFDARTITPAEEEELGLVIKPEDRPATLVDRRILGDWAAGKYDVRVALAASPADKQIPLKDVEPFFERHPIRNLIASQSYVLLNLGPEIPDPALDPNADPNAVDPTAPPTAPEETPLVSPTGNLLADDRFTRRGAGAGTGEEGLAGGPGAPGMEAGYMDMYYSPELEYYEEYGEEGGMSYAGTQLKGRGQPYVAVRGIIPLHELIRDVQEARNSDFAEAAQYFQLIDYVLERQTRLDNGQWPADDQWEQVDRTTAEGILTEVDGFDLDPVPPPLTDIAVTMPLPARITGVWKQHATHPDIQNFSLSQEQMENEFKLQVALLEKAREQQAQTEALNVNEPLVKPRGWSSFMHDSRQLQSELLGTESSYGTEYENYYSDQSESGVYGTMSTGMTDQNYNALVEELLRNVSTKPEQDAKLKEYIKSRVSAVGNVLLFRFIDFAVEPGKAYRYRARLEIENPNFGARVQDAADPSVVQGETRYNAWSNITDPVTVERDTFYFVASLEDSRNRAFLDFYHFDPALGTIVTNTEPSPEDEETRAAIERLEVGYGQPIAGVMPVWELDPAKMTFEVDEEEEIDPEKGYAFNSGDLLVTGLERIDLNRSEHPDLKIPRAGNYDLQLVDAILVARKDGELASVDTVSQQNWATYMAAVIEAQNEPFRDLKGGQMMLEEGMEYCPELLEMYGGEYEGAMGMEGGARRANTRNRTALRKSGSRADAGVRGASGSRSGGRSPRGGP